MVAAVFGLPTLRQQLGQLLPPADGCRRVATSVRVPRRVVCRAAPSRALRKRTVLRPKPPGSKNGGRGSKLYVFSHLESGDVFLTFAFSCKKSVALPEES